VRELLPDRRALATAPIGAQFVAFTRSDGSGPTPWVESNLGALPASVMVEVFHGIGEFRGLAWGFAREANRVVALDLPSCQIPFVACEGAFAR
jgi:hypothetical protein